MISVLCRRYRRKRHEDVAGRVIDGIVGLGAVFVAGEGVSDPMRPGRDVIASERRRSYVFSVNGDCCSRRFGYEVADGIAVGFRRQRNRERGYLSRVRRDCGCDALVSVKRVLYRVYAEEDRQVVYRRRSDVSAVHCHGCARGV